MLETRNHGKEIIIGLILSFAQTPCLLMPVGY